MMYSIIMVGLLVIATIGSALAVSLTKRPSRNGCEWAAFGLVPLAHFYMIAPDDEVAIFLPSVLCMLACYFIGFLFYSTGLPDQYVLACLICAAARTYSGMWPCSPRFGMGRWRLEYAPPQRLRVCQGWDMEPRLTCGHGCKLMITVRFTTNDDDPSALLCHDGLDLSPFRSLGIFLRSTTLDNHLPAVCINWLYPSRRP